MNNSTSTPVATSEKQAHRLTVANEATTLRQAASRLGGPYAVAIHDADGALVALVPWQPGDRKKADALAARMSATYELVAAAKDAAVRLREFVRDRIPAPTVEDLVEIHALEEAIRRAEGRA